MAKNPLRRRAEQLGFLLVARTGRFLARLLPLRGLWAIADGLAAVVMAATPKRQRLADAHIAAAFPALSAWERNGIRRRSVRCIARSMLELLKLPVLSRDELGRLVIAPDLTPVREAAERGHGVLLITAHLGNFELLGAYLSDFVAPVTVIARNAAESSTTSLVNTARASHGVSVVGREETRQMLQVLGSGGVLGVLPDQHAARGGILTEFLGRPAWTFTGPALLAGRTHARVFPVFLVRDFAGPFRLELYPEVVLARSDDREADVIENTRRINAALEQAIRDHPDNWLWLHDRWKKQKTIATPG